MTLSLKLLGGFSIRNGDGRELSLPTRKTCALLAYLAVNADRPQPRESLVALLWGDRGDRQARRSLNQALVSIRKLAGDNGGSFLNSDGEWVRLHGAALESDVARFHALFDDDPAGAAALYEGPFLDGLSIPEPAFEEWLAAMRSELETNACDALQRAADAAAAQGDTGQAIEAARRLVALDPLREDAHRLLMRLLFESGDRVAALRQYQACADILEKELQVAPDAATRALFEEIRRDAPETGDAPARAPEKPAAAAEIPATQTSRRRWLIPAFAASIALVIGVGAILWFAPWTPEPEPVAQICPSRVDKPWVAVLPFKNLSGDPQQEYLSDGISEDIITRLARRPDMSVIARTSSFSYKDKSVNVPQIGRELGVDYVLEGSVQKAGDRIRISAQLIEAATGNHLWVERYDHDIKDVFAMQDEITHKVAVELAVKLTTGELARINFKATENFTAYDYYLRGMEAWGKFTKKSVERARELFEKAIEHDPQYVRAIAYLGWVYMGRRIKAKNWGHDPEKSIKRAEELAARALGIDKNSATAHSLLGWLHAHKGQYEQAIIEGERAVAIEPSDILHRNRLAWIMLFAGRPKDATGVVAQALCLGPYPPIQVLSTEAQAHYMSGRYEATITSARKLLARNTSRNLVSRKRIIGSYMALGREAEARAEAKKHNEAYMKKHGRPYSMKKRAKSLKFRPWKDPSWIDVHAERMRKAGIPD